MTDKIRNIFVSLRRLTLAKYMSEKLSIDAKVSPTHVADDAVGVSNGAEKLEDHAAIGTKQA